jgi:OmpA-OmpF porin, OOP family
MKTKYGIAAAASLWAALALGMPSMSAAQSQEVGFYLGGAVGMTSFDDACPSGFSCDDEDTGFKFFGGYKFSPNLAAEVSYIDWGSLKASLGAASATADLTSWGIAAVGMWPLNPQFSVFGKLGILFSEVQATGTAGSVSDDDTELHLGLGAIYNFTRNLGVRAELEFANDSEARMVSIGVQYKF